MKQYPFFCAVILAVPLAGQELAKADRIVDGGGAARPPVLRTVEPADSMIVTLPAPPAPPRETNAPPTTVPPAGNDDPNDHRPLLRRAPKPILPSEFERDSALFTQKMIGLWSEPDAYNLFGEPLRERVVLDDQEVENGRIYAFTDPTGRYREVELDFAKDTGVLRTVFVYPWKMTWEDCRKQWGGNVRSTEANKGRIFHSYLNRRVDVLVDQRGLVISLGLY